MRRGMQLHRGAQMGDQFGIALPFVQEQVALPSSCNMAKASAKGVCGTSAPPPPPPPPPDIQQPADGIRQGDDGGIRARLLQALRQPGALGLAGFAGQIEGVRHGGPRGRPGLVGPHRVDGIGVAGDQRSAARSAAWRRPPRRWRCAARGRNPAWRPPFPSLGRGCRNPALRTFRHQIAAGEQLGVGLGGGLQRVAAIHEQGGLSASTTAAPADR